MTQVAPAGDMGSIPRQRTKIPQCLATWPKKKNKKESHNLSSSLRATLFKCMEFGPGGTDGKECRGHKTCSFDPWVRKNSLKEGVATHSSILPWSIPWTVESGGLQSMESPRVGHDWAAKQHTQSINTLHGYCSVVSSSLRPQHMPGYPAHGVFQARMLKWVDISYSRGSSWSGMEHVFLVSVSCTGRQILYHCTIWASPINTKSSTPPPIFLRTHGLKWIHPFLVSEKQNCSVQWK